MSDLVERLGDYAKDWRDRAASKYPLTKSSMRSCVSAARLERLTRSGMQQKVRGSTPLHRDEVNPCGRSRRERELTTITARTREVLAPFAYTTARLDDKIPHARNQLVTFVHPLEVMPTTSDGKPELENTDYECATWPL